MNRKYNFDQSQKLLDVDPKTFKKWLIEAGIDPNRQRNRADRREKWLSQEQVVMLANDHGRELPVLDQEEELDPTPVTLALLSERLQSLEEHISQRFDHLTALLLSLEQRIITQGDQSEGAMQDAVPLSLTPVELEPKPSPVITKRKQQTKAKRLPRTYIPLRVFAALHGISDKAADRARARGKVTTKHGHWLYNSRSVTQALDAQGKRDFYEAFHEREQWKPCRDCPHELVSERKTTTKRV